MRRIFSREDAGAAVQERPDDGYPADEARRQPIARRRLREAPAGEAGRAPAYGRAGAEVRRPGRVRGAGAATAGAVGSGFIGLARLVMAVAGLIALLIALAIVLRDVGANPTNTIVEGIHEGANFFAGSFTGLISFTGHPKRAITVDWGIALLAYLIVGSVLSAWLARLGRGGLRVGARGERARVA